MFPQVRGCIADGLTASGPNAAYLGSVSVGKVGFDLGLCVGRQGIEP